MQLSRESMAAFSWDWIESLKHAARAEQVPADWNARTARAPDAAWLADDQRPPTRRKTSHAVAPTCSPAAASQDLWRPVSSAHEPSALPILEPSSRLRSPSPTSIPAFFSPQSPPSAQPSFPQPTTPVHVASPTSAHFPTEGTAPSPPVRRRSALARGERGDAETEVLLQGLLSSAPVSRRLAALGLVLLLNGVGHGAAGAWKASAAEEPASAEEPLSPCSSVGSCDLLADHEDDTACTSSLRAADPWAAPQVFASGPLAASHAADTASIGSKRRRVDSFASLATAQDTWQSAQEAGEEERGQDQVVGSGAGEEAQGGQTEEFWQQQRQQLVEAIQTLLQGCAQLQRS
ncbi:unnamed protein product [Closterium sp. NIES-64]|nr:unnamed protein product [Closterium sp. NIES-64]CAI6012983.1 unnamed protein product [Closterium sp. NIES-65]